MPERNEKIAEAIKQLAAQFLARENNRTSLITVIHADASPDIKRATIYITVLPEDKEKEVLEFVKRKRGELRDVIKKTLSIKNVPFIDFAIDKGEKNRQKIDELLRQ